MHNERKPVGSILWLDLTVPNADEVRDFYAAVVGWKPEPLSMVANSLPAPKDRRKRAATA